MIEQNTAATALRRARITYAVTMISVREYVVCTCGALFYTPEPYADHAEQCEHVERRESAQPAHFRID